MQNQTKKVENIILNASIKISETFDINHLRWREVAACNFVKNVFNHKFFLFPENLLNRTSSDLRYKIYGPFKQIIIKF